MNKKPATPQVKGKWIHRGTRGDYVKIKICTVRPELPVDTEKRQKLIDSLEIMGLVSLVSIPWKLKNKSMIKELLGETENPFPDTIRASPKEWNEQQQ